MDIGQYNERVQFVKPVRTANNSGGGVETITTILDCWAKVRPNQGSRGEEAERTVIGKTAKLWCRFRPELFTDVDAETKVVAIGQTWKVAGWILIDNKKGIYMFEIYSNG